MEAQGSSFSCNKDHVLIFQWFFDCCYQRFCIFVVCKNFYFFKLVSVSGLFIFFIIIFLAGSYSGFYGIQSQYSLSQNSSKFLTEVLPHPDWWITFCKCIVEKLVVCLKLKKIQISSVINQSRQSHNRNPRTVASRCPPARSQPPAVCFRLFTFHVMQSV